VSIFSEALDAHPALAKRKAQSAARLASVRGRLAACPVLSGGGVTAFAAGSLARGEAGAASDLDIFVTTQNRRLADSRLFNYQVIAELIRVNEEEGFPEFSNDGQYLRVYAVEDLVNQTGSRADDEGNYFTARMLMLLEAQPLLHEVEFRAEQAHLVQNYFRDGKGREDFRPLFLLNDVLRYWRTLCLNYEQTRHDPSRKWRKKNVNLKFSRMVTVFGTVLPLMVLDADLRRPGAPLWELQPLERLALGLDTLADKALLPQWQSVLDAYEEFLGWKEADDIETQLGTLKAHIRERAAEISRFLHESLNHSSVPIESRRFLVL
jgi:predicted nucleotidyltransferase